MLFCYCKKLKMMYFLLMSKEEFSFIQRHSKEIKPIVDDQSAVDEILEGDDVGASRVKELLEQFETRVFRYENQSADSESRRILFEASQPANFSIVEPLTRELTQDSRCRSITILADSSAGKKLGESDLPLEPIHSEAPVLSDIPSGYDTALVLEEPGNSPAPMLLYSAKSVFGAKRLCVMSVGLSGYMARRAFAEPSQGFGQMDDVDLVFAADNLAKQFLSEQGNIPQEKITVTSSPLIDSIDQGNIDTLRAAGREKLRISNDARAALYMGFASDDLKYIGGQDGLNFRTYLEVLAGMEKAARSDPGNEYMLIVRTHPRARNVETLPESTELPENLRIVNGDSLEPDEALYASDIVACNPQSTEVLLGAYRGRAPAVFAFSDNEFGQICQRAFGDSGLQIISESKRARFVKSSDDFAELVKNWQPISPLPKPRQKSLEKIKEILLN